MCLVGTHAQNRQMQIVGKKANGIEEDPFLPECPGQLPFRVSLTTAFCMLAGVGKPAA